jgi:hypothetical protein
MWMRKAYAIKTMVHPIDVTANMSCAYIHVPCSVREQRADESGSNTLQSLQLANDPAI